MNGRWPISSNAEHTPERQFLERRAVPQEIAFLREAWQLSRDVCECWIDGHGLVTDSITATNSGTLNDMIITFGAVNATGPIPVQVTNAGCRAGCSSAVRTFYVPVTVGDQLIVNAGDGCSSNLSISDTASNIWNLIQPSSATGTYFATWQAKTNATGADKITVSDTSICTPNFTAVEYANVTQIDVSNSGTASSATTVTTGNITTNQTQEILISSGTAETTTGSSGYMTPASSSWVLRQESYSPNTNTMATYD